MADGEIKIKMNADAAGIIATLRKIGALEGEVGKGGRAAGAAMEEAWKGVITEGVLAARQTEKLREQLDRLREKASGGFMGGGWASFVTGLNQAKELMGSIVSGAVQIGRALYEHAIKPAMELEDALTRVSALNGGGAQGAAAAGRMDAVANAWQDFSTQGNNEFSARVEQAMRAGLDMEQAMRAVQSTFIAAQGHQQTADAMLSKILEVEASGAVTERAIKTFERQGLDMRAALAEQFGVTREEVSGLLSSGEVGVQDLLGALQRLTSEGTRAWSSFQESLDTTSAEVRRAQNDWSDALKGLGTEMLPAVVEAMKQISSLVRKLGPEFRVLGETLSNTVLFVLEKAVSFITSALEKMRYLVNLVTLGKEKADQYYDETAAMRDAERAGGSGEEENFAYVPPPTGRIADPEDDTARRARQQATREERVASKEMEEHAKNTVALLEESDRKRYEWVMRAGRYMDVNKAAGENAAALGALREKVAKEQAAGKTLVTNERLGDLRQIAQLEERAAALEGRRTKLLSQRMAVMAKGLIDAEAGKLGGTWVGEKSSVTRSSMAQIGGGGNSFLSLQSVQLQQTKQQTATLKQLEELSRNILKVIPRSVAGAILY